MFKKFFEKTTNFNVIIAVVITLLTCWFADTHNDWNFDMMLKEVNTIFVILVSFGIIPLSMYKKWRKKTEEIEKKTKKKND